MKTKLASFTGSLLVGFLVLLVVLTLGSCSGNSNHFAYTGRMDVNPITISSQASGVIDSLNVAEGDPVKKGQVLGQINTDRLVAQRKQQEAQLTELDVRRSAAQAQITQAKAQIAQAQAQLHLAQETLEKTEKVLAQGGATQQRRDELSTQVQVDRANLAAGNANLAALQSNYKLIAAQENELRAGMDITDISIRDAVITSPINGVILNKFHYAGELAAVGTPLLELADLSEMTVEIYVPLSKLGQVTIGKHATITVDGESKQLSGTVYWISSEAEFTPKTILTQETRTTLVYGVKIRVPNPNGILKIGMPVDVQL